MYLTKFKLDPRHPQARQGLVNAHDMHRNLLNLFDAKRQDNNVLFSVNRADDICDLYLQSDIQPTLDAKRLDRYGMTMEYSVNQEGKCQAVKNGTEYSFLLDAMPCKAAVQNDICSRGKRQVLQDPESRLQWLDRKGEQYGFQLLSAREHAMERINVLRKGVSYFLPRYRYTGKLLVTDEARFLDALQKGIGPGKSYGLGLLLIF